MTNCVWSWGLKRNIGFVLISSICEPGEAVEVLKEGAIVRGTLRDLPFL